MTTAQERADEATGKNPFFRPSSLPLLAPEFDRIRDEHYRPALEAGMAEHLAEVRAIAAQEAAPTFANTIEALERSGALLTRVSKVFFNLTESTTNKSIQEVQAAVAPLLARHADAVRLDPQLFARIEAVYAARASLDAEARRTVERYRTDFVRSGAELDAKSQARLRTINEELSTLVTKFQEKLLGGTTASAVVVDREDELLGLDEASISAAAAAAKAAGLSGKFLLTLQLPTSQGILSQLQVRSTRERVFRASMDRCSRGGDNDTRSLCTRIAGLRAERAALFGYQNHAAYVLDDQMAKTPEAVRAMLDSMTPAIVAKADEEARQLREHFQETEPGATLKAWDWAYVQEQVRKAQYDLDEAEVRNYFELDRVLHDGLFFTAEQLYGVTMHRRTDLPVYHEDVVVYEMKNTDGSTVGLFYADYYARQGKRGGAWMDSFVDQASLLSQLPVVINVMNLQKPGTGQPTLLSSDEVTTLYHEFGHGVHGLFSTVRYPLLSGTNVPRDFVEFPSQFHEDFAFDKAVLQRSAVHWKTKLPMPDALVDKILLSRTFGQGFASLEYLQAALLDLAWHTLPAGEVVADPLAFEAGALAAAKVAHPLVPPRYRTPYFAHIWSGGYSAGYYAYLWSEALAADAFAKVREDGGIRKESGMRYRDLVLGRGFTTDPMQMFAEFMGRPLDTKALLIRRGLR
ncbi:MAG: M3 family metallopeptidase [Planctomycetota bacterium]